MIASYVLNEVVYGPLHDSTSWAFHGGFYFFGLYVSLQGWGQIDEHCWSNNVGTSHLNNVKTVCDQHDHTKFVFWFLSSISAQQMCA